MAFTPEDAKKRHLRVTGTRAGKILGINPFGGPVEAWEDIMGLSEPIPENEAMTVGILLEEPIIQLLQKRTGLEVSETECTILDYDDRFCATPDGVVYNDDGTRTAIEIKTTKNAHHWGKPGTDEIPYYYFPQVTLEMAVLDAKDCVVGMFSNNQLHVYRVERDYVLESKLIDYIGKWYDKYVKTGIRPDDTSNSNVAAYLHNIYPKKTSEIREGDRVDAGLVAQYMYCRAEAAKYKELMKEAEAALKERIGHDYAIDSGDYRVCWSSRSGAMSLDFKAMEKDGIDLSKYKKQGAPFRVFQIRDMSFKKENVGKKKLSDAIDKLACP